MAKYIVPVDVILKYNIEIDADNSDEAEYLFEIDWHKFLESHLKSRKQLKAEGAWGVMYSILGAYEKEDSDGQL